MKALNTNLVGMCGLCIIVLSSSGLCSVPENDRDAAETDADASAAASILMPDEATIQRTIEEAERTVEERLLRRMEAGAQSKRKLGRKVTPG